MADVMLRWLASNDGGALAPEVLQTAASLVSHELAPPPRAPETLSGVLMSAAIPARLGLAVAAAFFACPPSGPLVTLQPTDVAARSRCMAWALHTLAPLPTEQILMGGPRRKEEAPDVGAVFAAISSLCLGLPPPTDAVHAVAAACWWEEDAAEEAMRGLNRGVELGDAPELQQQASLPPPLLRLVPSAATKLLDTVGTLLADRLVGAREAAHCFSLVAVSSRLYATAACTLSQAPPACWSSDGAVQRAVQSALERAAGALSDRSAPRLLFTPRLLVAAQALGAAYEIESAGAADALGDTVLGLRAALHAAVRTVQADAHTAAKDREMLFDDDDFNEPAPAAPTQRGGGEQWTQHAGATQAAAPGDLLETPLETCVHVIAALGMARPTAAADVLCSLAVPLPENERLPLAVHDAAVAALCTLAGAPPAAAVVAADALTASLSAIVEEAAGTTAEALRVPRLLQNVAALAALVPKSPAADAMEVDAGAAAEPRTLQVALADLCSRVFGDPASAVDRFGILRSLGASTGVALADAVCRLLHAGHQPQSLTIIAAELLRDVRYAVRRAMAPRFAVMLCTFPAPEHPDIMDYVRSCLAGLAEKAGAEGPAADRTINTHATQETTILQLAELVVASAVLEKDAVFDIIELAASYPVHVPFAMRALTRAASRLGYPDRFGLVRQHLPYIAQRWMSGVRDVDSLLHARELLAPQPELVKTGSELARAYARYMLPSLVVMRNGQSVQRLADLCNISPSELVTTAYPRTIASLHARRVMYGELGKRAFTADVANPEAVLPKAAGGVERLTALLGHKVTSVVIELIFMARPPLAGDDEPPVGPPTLHSSLSEKTIVAAVADVEKTFDASGREQIWWLDLPVKYLSEVHHTFDQALAVRHRMVALARLSALLSVLDERSLLCVPSTFRYSVHLLLLVLPAAPLQGKALGLLHLLVDRALAGGEAGPAGPPLCDLLWPLVTRLVAAAQADAAAPPSAALLDLLRKLVSDAPRWLQPRVAELDPFPGGAAFAALREAHEALCLELPLSGRLQRFCDRARRLPPATRHAAAQALIGLLRAPRATAELRACEEAPACAWRLAQLCEHVHDEAVQELAAAALAAVGLHDPFAVAFHAPGGGAASEAEAAATAAVTASSRRLSGPAAAKSEGVALAAAVLRALAGYLMDSQSRVVRVAALTLRYLLRTAAGAQAFRTLTDLEQAYLKAWQASRGEGTNLDDVLRRAQQSAGAPVPLNDDALWLPPLLGAPRPARAYASWLCKLTHALLFESRAPTLRICHALAAHKADFAELLLPHVLADIAADRGAGEGGAALRQLLSRKVEACVLRNAAAQPRATHTLLGCLAFLRAAHVAAGLRGLPATPGTPAAAAAAAAHPASPSSWATCHWLDIDYLCVAGAALRVGACMTALQYVEHWCETAHGELALRGVDALNDAGPLPPHMAAALEAHSATGEPDGIYGCLSSPHVALQLRRAEHEGAWGRALAVRDAALHAPQAGGEAAATARGVLRALQKLGCAHIAGTVARSLADQCSDDASFREAQMELAWREGQWDAPDAAHTSDDDSGPAAAFTTPSAADFHACLAASLRALHGGEVSRCASLLSQGRAGVVRSIALSGAESAAAIHANIVRLHLLDEVADVAQARWGSPTATSAMEPRTLDASAAQALSRRWQAAHTASLDGRFDLLEPLLAGRTAAMRAVGSTAGAAQALAAAAAAARAAGLPETGLARIHEIKIACAAASASGGAVASERADVAAPDAAWRKEEAALLWADGQHELALVLARALASARHGSSDAGSVARHAGLLSTLGSWLAERHGESAERIKANYFGEAISELNRGVTRFPGAATELHAARCDAFFQLAQFLDNLHRVLGDRMSVPEWQQGLRLREHTGKEITQYEAQEKTLKAEMAGLKDAAARAQKEHVFKDVVRRIKTLRLQIATDDNERRLVMEQHAASLLGCLEAYGSCLAASGGHDTEALFRLVALWFKGSGSAQVNAKVGALVRKLPAAGVPSAKFLPLVWQLVARLEAAPDSDASGFQPVLHMLVVRLATEHPYHTLFQLLALQAAASVGEHQLVHAPLTKVAAARAVLDAVRATSPRFKAMVAQMEMLASAYSNIAFAPVPSGTGTFASLPLPANVQKRHFGKDGLPLVPIITAPLKLDPTCAYAPGSFTSFMCFEGEMSLVGGINAPKKIRAQGSNGVSYLQMAKGKDDLRQDAVMQQVFGHVSALLATAPGSRARALRMHTYKVIPFSPLAGVVEWVDDTMPLSEYLFAEARNAHVRLRPQDMAHKDARKALEDAVAGNPLGKHARLRAAFDHVCAHYKPVMHNFFLENFLSAALWYERRLAYTRSVAVSSMLGYVIGLGDRHSSNILIGRASGELVHIDLGVAFEQGRLLPTPEMVPFRLTRDLVDGMGANGVDGVMRRCSEETLAVLRANKESLLTLVEVLIHDPILKWAMSPELARRRQRGRTDEEGEESGEEGGAVGALPLAAAAAATQHLAVQNADAERALLRVRQKLDGVEGGEPRSIEGQVQQLVQEARDPDKLCVMYPGWAPFV